MIKPKTTIENLAAQKHYLEKKDWRLKLDFNENIYGCSPLVFNALKNINKEELSFYPNYSKLIDKLAKTYELNASDILLTNGCDEAIKTIIDTYLDKDDEFLCLNPTFFVPLSYVKTNGAKVVQIDYEEKFVFRPNLISSNITQKTKMVYLATPNNPTGDIIRSTYIEELVQKYKDVLFIIDCTYIDFCDKISILDFVDLAKKYDNIAVLQSFSKFYGLAGLRLGCVLANDNIIKNLEKVIPLFNVNCVALICAISAMNDEKFLDEVRENNQNAKALLKDGLSNLGFNCYQSEGNFLLCDFGDYRDFYYEKLKKNGVIVAQFAKNSKISTCLRITVPKIGGVKYILELLVKKDILIFNLDNVLFDVTNSYLSAAQKTFEYFSKTKIELCEIQKQKYMLKPTNYWELTKNLLKNKGHDIEITEIINVFQEFLCSLLDSETLLFSKEQLNKLSKKYNMVVFCDRLKDEAIYSLEKNEIDKYFSYFVTSDDLPKNMLKPNPKGALEILKHCPYKKIKYLCGSINDVICAKGANIESLGIVSPVDDYNLMVNNYRHLGVKNIFNKVEDVIEFLN